MALASSTPQALLLLDFGTSPERHITDAGFDVTHGGVTYEADDALFGTSRPDQQAEVSRDLYQVTFVESDREAAGSWKRLFGKGRGIKFRARVVFRTDDGTITDTLHVHKGVCRRVEHPIMDGDDDESAIIIGLRLTFGGPFSKLDDEPSVVMTPEDQARRDPSDNSLDKIHRVSDIVWGR